ncbi:hypothetical protein HMPREF3107_09635 [Neisseria sp. HMSC31F04]|nr:hypothetical protein HMPREF3107_09635 [Neisseria sp. HMSC31F04]
MAGFTLGIKDGEIRCSKAALIFTSASNENLSIFPLNQDKATKSQTVQTVQIVRQGEATPYWFKVNPL